MAAMARRALVASLVAALAGVAAQAGAAAGDEREPAVGLAVGTGASVAIAPLLAGGVLFASTDDDGLRRTGVYLAMAGLVVAPTVEHLAVHEYKRAAIFAALPLAALLTNVVVFQYDPKTASYGSAYTRTTFGVALTAATLGATVGLADTFGAADRWRAKHRVMVAPTVVPGGGGLALGGRY